MKSILSKLFILFLLPIVSLGQPINDIQQLPYQKQNKYQPLLDAAKKSNSDALIVIEDGKKVVNYHKESEDELIESMLVTKSVVGLAIARLLTENKIDSLDTPIAQYYPEWRQGQKKDITIRHLMNHTSGLQNRPNTSAEIQPSPDFYSASTLRLRCG